MKTHLITELLCIVVNDETLFVTFDATEMSEKVALNCCEVKRDSVVLSHGRKLVNRAEVQLKYTIYDMYNSGGTVLFIRSG